ncbi:hypothetical protein GRJ2_001618600 [Grus japonensis]|uniref:Uncharacterized protein n=1 Tax=Grus japonensis TaxID=30415 RepID=A0ABC9X1G9_GRUJA
MNIMYLDCDVVQNVTQQKKGKVGEKSGKIGQFKNKKRLGVTRNTVFGFGLPLCKEDIEKVDDLAEDLQEVKGLLCLTKDERLRGLGLFRLAKRELRGEAATLYD